MNPLFDYISKRVEINTNNKSIISSLSKTLQFKKGTQLIKPCQSVNKTYFVLKGCLRSFIHDKEGKEHTLQFAVKDEWISDYIAIFNNEKSIQTIECVSDCSVIEISIHEGIENLFSKCKICHFRRVFGRKEKIHMITEEDLTKGFEKFQNFNKYNNNKKESKPNFMYS